MVKVEFLGPIEHEELNLDVKSLKELKIELKKYPDIAKWLPISAVAVNNKICENINIELKNGDVIVILPPVCGGNESIIKY